MFLVPALTLDTFSDICQDGHFSQIITILTNGNAHYASGVYEKHTCIDVFPSVSCLCVTKLFKVDTSHIKKEAQNEQNDPREERTSFFFMPTIK